jgi:uncharacterized protein with FMN-binding domain
MQPTISNSRRRWVAGLAAVAILAVMTAGVIVLKDNEKKTSTATVPTTSTAASTTPASSAVSAADTTATTPSAAYKNGTYTATGNYTSPGGSQAITVTVTIANDTISDSSANPQPSDHESAQYQEIFADNYKQFVVGRNVDSVSLSRVSGSSLTSRGFNDALEQIKQQAKA